MICISLLVKVRVLTWTDAVRTFFFLFVGFIINLGDNHPRKRKYVLLSSFFIINSKVRVSIFVCLLPKRASKKTHIFLVDMHFSSVSSFDEETCFFF